MYYFLTKLLGSVGRQVKHSATYQLDKGKLTAGASL